MRSILFYNELWDYLSGELTKPIDVIKAEEWTKQDWKALVLIVLGVSTQELGHIRKAETSKMGWSYFEDIYKSRGPVRIVVLYRTINVAIREWFYTKSWSAGGCWYNSAFRVTLDYASKPFLRKNEEISTSLTQLRLRRRCKLRKKTTTHL